MSRNLYDAVRIHNDFRRLISGGILTVCECRGIQNRKQCEEQDGRYEAGCSVYRAPLGGMCDTLAVDAHRLPPFESAELVEFKLAAKGCVAVRASRCSLKSARVESSGLFRSLSPRQKDQARAHEPRTDHMILARRYFRIARHDPFYASPAPPNKGERALSPPTS